MFTATVLFVSSAMTAEPKLTFEGASRHPTVNLTPEDAERARKRIRSDPAAKAWFEQLQKSVKKWDDKDPAWVRSVMPGEGACFAYGFTGCPICGGRWSAWIRARCSLDRPGTVTCGKGHVLPDKDHPDPGTGYKAKDGRIHYFVGSYNAWIVENLIFNVAEPYAKIYLLTKDERAGRMAVVVLDEIARIYPSCDKGSWDYPSNPPSGRLCRPWYQVARVLVHFVDIYDWVFDHPAMEEPSSRQGLTRRQNIEKNLLLNGGAYCYEMSVQSGGLHNGEADYLRGVLSVGVVLGIPEYVRWPVGGPYGIRTMLANNVDRDGRYFETAAGYALHTRNLYLTFAEPLVNYRGSAFPEGLNLYDDARFESFLLLPQMATVCLGQDPPFGDASPIVRGKTPPYRPGQVHDIRYADYLATRLSDPTKRAQYAALVGYLTQHYASGKSDVGAMTEWRTFHRPDEASSGGALSERMKQYLDGSFFFGQKGLAVLRVGQGEAEQAAILRFGPSLVHGHLDDLNVNYFARGYELPYDIGYSLGSTHTQVGWAKQTVSHNTVAVDEKSQGGGTFGGSLLRFADLPGLALAEGSSTVYGHKGIDVYRRLFVLTDRYALDVFRVRGGKQHDLPLHCLSTDVQFEGLAFGEAQDGSLAGKEIRWGELQLNDGDMKGAPNKPYWNPPPRNGYGFLCAPARATPTGDWSATWRLEDKAKTRFQLLALHEAGTEVIQAEAPGLYPTLPRARYVIRRRRGDKLSSSFVSVWQAFADKAGAAVKAVRRLGGEEALTADSAVVVAVELNDGGRDVWCLGASDSSTFSVKDGQRPVVAEGALARVRMKGKAPVAFEMVDARRVEVAGWRIELDAPSRRAMVVGMPTADPTIRIDTDWPDDGRYDGDPAYVTNPRYSRNSAYTLRQVSGSKLVVAQSGTLLGRGVIDQVKDERTLISKVPHEYARPVTRSGPSGFFDGKVIQTADGEVRCHINEVTFGGKGVLTIRVDTTTGFKPGQAYIYHDVQPGDFVTVQHYASMVRVNDGQYALRTNTDVTITAPDGAAITYVNKLGMNTKAKGNRIPRSNLPRSGETTIKLAG
ncbi:MAG: heparinase II/III family protein [Phycisphaerae bacterium]|nr:heparinase II/III family protein [Phycisphaerae bacterium]